MKSPVKVPAILQRTLKFPLLLLLVVITCTACDPSNRIVWSPDGKQMALIAGDGLHLGTAAGNLTASLLSPAEQAVWLPDSQHLLVVHRQDTNSWKQLAEILPTEDVKTILAEAARVRTAILSYKGKWDDFDKDDSLSELRFGPEDVIYLRAHHNQELLKIMGQKWKEVETLKASIWSVQLYETHGQAISPGAIVYRSARHIEDLRLSPDGKLLALTESTRVEGGPTYRLSVLALTGGKPRIVSELAAKYPDWLPDSRNLVYIESLYRQSSSDYPFPGILRKVAAAPTDNSAPADLAELVFRNNNRVRCLPDGRILFSCPEVSLPASPKSINWVQGLFGLDLSKQSAVIRMTPNSADSQLGDLAEYFEPNPDGSKVAIPSRNGSISILTLSDATVMNSPKPADEKPVPFIPQWRSNDQLCLPVSADGRIGIGLWSITSDKQQQISSSWPASALKGLLE